MNSENQREMYEAGQQAMREAHGAGMSIEEAKERLRKVRQFRTGTAGLANVCQKQDRLTTYLRPHASWDDLPTSETGATFSRSVTGRLQSARTDKQL
jgi:hypothetical protein